jgi:co-chaperonin GroES (HSP10)
MRAIGKNVIIKPIVDDVQSGLIITGAKTASEERSINKGTVVSVGQDVQEDIQIGDIGYYIEATYWKNGKRVNTDEFVVDGETFIGVKAHEIKLIER